jgi:hypothetical protein
LQDRGTYGEADGAAETAEEVPDGDDDGALGFGRVGLERDDGWLECGLVVWFLRGGLGEGGCTWKTHPFAIPIMNRIRTFP